MNVGEKAKRILEALDDCNAPITWHCIDEPDLIKAIIGALKKIEKEENDEKNSDC